MKKEAVILHPGPLNRGVEIESELADSNRALILNQVKNGIAVRMAILYLYSVQKFILTMKESLINVNLIGQDS